MIFKPEPKVTRDRGEDCKVSLRGWELGAICAHMELILDASLDDDDLEPYVGFNHWDDNWSPEDPTIVYFSLPALGEEGQNGPTWTFSIRELVIDMIDLWSNRYDVLASDEIPKATELRDAFAALAKLLDESIEQSRATMKE